MVYIRADANEVIGMGHIMRCISIAEEMRQKGEDVTFIVADQKPTEILRKHRFLTICLQSQWNNLETEADALVKAVCNNKAEKILIDSYYVTRHYLESLQKHTETIYLDDVNRFIYPVDKLINYNIYAVDLEYEKRYREENMETRFALGCSFVPLRREFSGVSRMVREKVSKILITAGGTDNYNVLDYILQSLSKCKWFKEIICYVVVGKFHRNKGELLKNWKDFRNVKLLSDVQNMAEIIEQCDMAVTAGGVTVYEIMACGLPAVIYTLADNQHAIAKYMSEKGLMPWVGDIRVDMDGCMHKMIEFLEELYEDRNKREEISNFMQSVVDGRGSKRLADWVLED